MHFFKKGHGTLTFYIKNAYPKKLLNYPKKNNFCILSRIGWGRILPGLIKHNYSPSHPVIWISFKALNYLIQVFSPKAFIDDHLTLIRDELKYES